MIASSEQDILKELERREQMQTDTDLLQNRAYLDNINYEKWLMEMVKKGMPEQLEHADTFQGSYAREIIKSPKKVHLALLTLNTLCMRAAIAGHLDVPTASNLADILSEQIEACEDESDLRVFLHGINIPVLYAKQVNYCAEKDIRDERIRAAMLYIRNNYQKNISIRDVAAETGLSPDYLSHLFRRETGRTITETINEMKVDRAKALLRFTDLPLSRIAYLLNFSSQSYFQSVFRKSTGETPGAYRRAAE